MVGALITEWVKRGKKARKTILKQINYVNKFAVEKPEDFVVAKSLAKLRDYVKTPKRPTWATRPRGQKDLSAAWRMHNSGPNRAVSR